MRTYCPNNLQPFGTSNYQHNDRIHNWYTQQANEYNNPQNEWKRFQEKQRRLEESRW